LKDRFKWKLVAASFLATALVAASFLATALVAASLVATTTAVATTANGLRQSHGNHFLDENFALRFNLTRNSDSVFLRSLFLNTVVFGDGASLGACFWNTNRVVNFLGTLFLHVLANGVGLRTSFASPIADSASTSASFAS
jgi:hypothetical protein